MHLHLQFSDDILFPSTLGKLETKIFGGGGWKFEISHMNDINEMRANFQFFIMADTDIPFPSTLRKWQTQNFGGSVI